MGEIDEKLKQLKIEDKPTLCTKCGGLLKFKGRGTYVCEDCGFKEYDDFGKIDKYLEAHGPSPAPIISRGTGLSIARVRELLSEGKLEAIPGSEGKIDADIGQGDTAPIGKSKAVYMGGNNNDSGRIRFQGGRR